MSKDKTKYEFLSNLGNADSKFQLRGMGECLGRDYMFFNKPYIYASDTSNIVYNVNKKEFKAINLKTDNLICYNTNEEIMELVCRNGNSCETIDDDVYFMTFIFEFKCYFVVYNNMKKMSAFALNNNFDKKFEHLVLLRGTPFSACGSSVGKTLKMLYMVDWKLDTKQCEYAYYGSKECVKKYEKLNIRNGNYLIYPDINLLDNM